MLFAPLLLKDAVILVQEAALKQAGFGKTWQRGFTKNLHSVLAGMLGLLCAINPSTLYVVFRASDKRQIKTQLVANGYSIGKSCNAELALIRSP